MTGIAIAGAGIVGLSTAWRLTQRGYHVTIYEKSTVGAEASWAAAGMLAPGGEIDSPSEMACLALEARRAYRSFVRELEEATQLPIDYQECGALDLAYSADELAALQARVARQLDIGIPSKPVPPERIRAFWPRVRTEDLAGAHFYPEDGLVSPRDLLAALRRACENAGVEIIEHCPVQRIHVEAKRVRVDALDDAFIHNAAIVAAGAWSSSIEIQGAPSLPAAQPVKGHLIGYQQPQQVCNSILRQGHTYIAQRASGLLIAGSSMERVGFNRDIDAEIARSLEQRAGFLLPHLKDTAPAEVWIGFRPESDTLHVGRWHSPRLYVCYGHFRNGILLAPITANRIAAQISANSGTY